MLLFKTKFKDAILDGTKTTTMRHWKRRWAPSGSIQKTNLGIRLQILSNEQIALKDISDTHAQADGFPNRASLVEELGKYYSPIPETLTLIAFSPLFD